MPPEEKGFIKQVCDLKHTNIDKNIGEIKRDIEKIKNNENKQHEDIKKMIIKLGDAVEFSHKNIKNKVVLSEKATGDKIDTLNKFDEGLRGNGKPGIWESVRNIKRNIKVIIVILILIAIMILGGNYRGVSIESIRQRLGISSPTTQQVENVEEQQVEENPITNENMPPTQ